MSYDCKLALEVEWKPTKVKNIHYFLFLVSSKSSTWTFRNLFLFKKNLYLLIFFLPILELGGVSPNLKNQNNLIPICSTFLSHSLEWDDQGCLDEWRWSAPRWKIKDVLTDWIELISTKPSQYGPKNIAKNNLNLIQSSPTLSEPIKSIKKTLYTDLCQRRPASYRDVNT